MLRRALFVVVLLALAGRANAVMQMRNLTISPEFICPGQAVTLTWQQSYTTNNGYWTWGVFSTNDATWDNPNDYTFMSTTFPNGSTASSTTGVPTGLQTLAVGPNAPGGFWQTYTWTTTIPVGIVGPNITFIIKGNDGAQNWAFTVAADAFLSYTTEVTCAKKAIYNEATLWEQTSRARLVIQNSCGTPSFTPTRTATPTHTGTRTSTATPTNTPSFTNTVSPSSTRTGTPSYTQTPSYTITPSFTATRSPTFTVTDTNTTGPSPTFTATPSYTSTRTNTPSSTETGSYTFTRTSTMTITETNSPGPSPTFTATHTQTSTQTITPIYTATNTPSSTSTATNTASSSPSPTLTSSASVTETRTSTGTPTASPSASSSPSVTGTRTSSPTSTESATPSNTRTVTNTFSASPSITVSPTITATIVPVPFSVQVVLYNSAGERVRILYDGSAQRIPIDISLSTQLLQIGTNQVDLNMGGMLNNGSTMVSWRGQNDSGQSVRGGMYYFKVEYNDPFGHTTSYVKSVQVVEGQGGNYLGVYNSAGEEVFRQDLTALPKGINNFNVDKESLAVAVDANGVAQGAITFTLTDSAGAQLPYVWNGLNSQGKPLASGTYTVRLINETNTGAVSVSRQVALIKGTDPSLKFEPFMAPNPAPIGGVPGRGRVLAVAYPWPGLSEARATMYNQVGEKVSASGDPGNSGQIWLSYESLASGIYLVEVTGRTLAGSPYRRVLKAAILH